METRPLTTILWIGAVLLVTSTPAADDSLPPICPLVLHEERVDLEERELAVELARSRLGAADSIFALVDELWSNDAVERIVYLTARHERDVAGVEVKRQQLLAKRQEATIAQYEAVCTPLRSGESRAERRETRRAAERRYEQADCHRIGKLLAIAELDLAFRTEVLESVRSLRADNVATQPDVIRAERDVELASKRVEHEKRRVDACVESGAATAKP